MRWFPHVDAQGQTYSLNHLHPFRFSIEIGSREVQISVGFAMHCFSKALVEGDDEANIYSDDREQRTFCQERYDLSWKLPQIVRALPQGHCLFARDDNFVTIDITMGMETNTNTECSSTSSAGKIPQLIQARMATTRQMCF